MTGFDQQLTKVVVALCDALGTSVSHSVKSMVLEGKWCDLVATTVHPRDYSDPESYLKDAIATEFLRKLQGLPTGIDLHGKAIETFWTCERQCEASNLRLKRYTAWFREGFVGDELDNKLFEFITQVRGIIRDVLGPLPRDLVPKFGKGATYYDRGREITIPHKMSSQPTRTPQLWWGDLFLHRTMWGFATLRGDSSRSAPRFVRGNRFTSVPKDSSKNRGICVEPGVNLALQLPVGAFLKERLLRVAGIDLKNGQQEHRDLARQASIDGKLATIDLSNASDTVCSELVSLLLPGAWRDLLMDLRSPYTKVEGKWVRLSKFSSMGNGFTFELETLIYYAISRACSGDRDTVKVYGDDIIVTTAAAPGVLGALALFGFTPNRKKTFVEGPFRESCGGDFFNGVAVRPYYQNEIPTEPNHWIVLANGLRCLGVTDSKSGAWRFGLLHPWLRALDAIPGDIRRLRGPRSFGDQLIHDDPSRWVCVRQYGRDGYRRWVRTWEPVFRREPLNKFHPDVQFAAALYGVPSTGVVPRGGVKGYRKRWKALIECTEFEGDAS